MFILKKIILACVGMGIAFVVSSNHDINEKKHEMTMTKPIKEKIERHRQRW